MINFNKYHYEVFRIARENGMATDLWVDIGQCLVKTLHERGYTPLQATNVITGSVEAAMAVQRG